MHCPTIEKLISSSELLMGRWLMFSVALCVSVAHLRSSSTSPSSSRSASASASDSASAELRQLAVHRLFQLQRRLLRKHWGSLLATEAALPARRPSPSPWAAGDDIAWNYRGWSDINRDHAAVPFPFSHNHS